jgi:hypothetical protein
MKRNKINKYFRNNLKRKKKNFFFLEKEFLFFLIRLKI